MHTFILVLKGDEVRSITDSPLHLSAYRVGFCIREVPRVYLERNTPEFKILITQSESIFSAAKDFQEILEFRKSQGI